MRVSIVAIFGTAACCSHSPKPIGQAIPVSKPNTDTSEKPNNSSNVTKRPSNRTELLTLQIQTGVGPLKFYYLGLFAKLFTIRSDNIYWSVVEGGGGSFLNLETARYFYIGSRVGYPLALDSEGNHQLRFGLGLGYGATVQENDGPEDRNSSCVGGMYLSPNFRYAYQFSKNFSIGLDLQALFSTVCSSDYYGGDYPWALFLSVPVAWSM